MEEQFVPYAIALRLKELGFDGKCFAGYSTSQKQLEHYSRPTYTNDSFTVDAPLYQQVFDWFRDVHDFMYKIEWNKFYPENPYDWTVRPIWRDEPLIPYGRGGMKSTFIDAQNACIETMIQMVSKPDDTLLDAFQEEAFD